MPGTELAFAGEVACLPAGLLGWKTKTINHQTAIFRQVNKEKLAAHHDALEFPDGRIVLLTLLREGQTAVCVAAAGGAQDRGPGARAGTRRLCWLTGARIEGVAVVALLRRPASLLGFVDPRSNGMGRRSSRAHPERRILHGRGRHECVLHHGRLISRRETCPTAVIMPAPGWASTSGSFAIHP